MSYGLCFWCCGFKKYWVKECMNNVRCDVCNGFYFVVFYEDNCCYEGEKSKGIIMYENEVCVEMVLFICI